MVEWDKVGLFISLVTPLVLGIGAWVLDAVSKRKRQPDATPEVVQGMAVDYETDYVNLLKRNLAEVRKENSELRRRLSKLEGRNNGNSDNH